jgi:tRNA pseudouridine32 synthase/23S rRNA pseudouridine746 synthase
VTLRATEPVTTASAQVVFMDEHLLVVDKPSGMPSVPARTARDPLSVVTVLAAVHGPLEAAHRLDRDTSGLLLLARTTTARTALGRCFEARGVDKRYLAVVRGSPPSPAGRAHLPLADDPSQPPRKRIDPVLGRRAVTAWQTLAYQETSAGPATLLCLEPLTGRSHQLRAHLAWLGCPILGDRLYDAATADLPLALHAATLRFPHPVTQSTVELSCPPPPAPPWIWFPEATRLLTTASARAPNG